MKRGGNSFRSWESTYEIAANSTTYFGSLLIELSIRSTIDQNLGFSRKNSAAQERSVCVAKHNAVITRIQINSVLAAKVRIKKTLEDCGDGGMSKGCGNLAEVNNVTSRKTSFRTTQHAVAKYVKTKNGLSFF